MRNIQKNQKFNYFSLSLHHLKSYLLSNVSKKRNYTIADSRDHIYSFRKRVYFMTDKYL